MKKQQLTVELLPKNEGLYASKIATAIGNTKARKMLVWTPQHQ